MTNTTLALAFNEWMRRYTENPDQFYRDWQTVGEYQSQIEKGITPTYGDACAMYLRNLIGELDNSIAITQLKD